MLLPLAGGMKQSKVTLTVSGTLDSCPGAKDAILTLSDPVKLKCHLLAFPVMCLSLSYQLCD